MPIYEFECAGCGTRFDRLQRLSDPDPTRCPQCDAAQVRRRLTAPAFRLSGSGWYETDFKSDKDGKRNTGADTSFFNVLRPHEGHLVSGASVIFCMTSV